MFTGILCTGQRRFFILCLLEHTKKLRMKISVSRAVIHTHGPVGILIWDLKLFWKKVDPKCMLSLINFNCYSVLMVVVRINESQYYEQNSGVLSSNILSWLSLFVTFHNLLTNSYWPTTSHSLQASFEFLTYSLYILLSPPLMYYFI